MKASGNRLTSREREYLLQLLEEQQSQEALSNEENRRLGIDRNGETYDLGGSSQGVLIGESGIPRVISEEHTVFLDCGHAITSPSQVLGKCGNGHVICNLHDHMLLRCVKCGKLLCHLCAEIDDEGNPVCPDHGFSWSVIFIIAGIVMIVLWWFVK